jgi:hypothetical protein
MKELGDIKVDIHIFLISAPQGGVWSASRPGYFTLKESPSPI